MRQDMASRWGGGLINKKQEMCLFKRSDLISRYSCFHEDNQYAFNIQLLMIIMFKTTPL